MSSCTCFAGAPSECIGFLDAPVLSFEEIVYFCTLDRDFKEMIFRASRENGLLECMLSFSNLLFFTQYCGARELPEARAKWTIAAIFLRMLHGESLQPSFLQELSEGRGFYVPYGDQTLSGEPNLLRFPSPSPDESAAFFNTLIKIQHGGGCAHA